LALSLKESIENLIASFIIFFDKPFMAGDNVKVNQYLRDVERIGLRSTRIRTDLKTYVTVPNNKWWTVSWTNRPCALTGKAESDCNWILHTSCTIGSFVEGLQKELRKKNL